MPFPWILERYIFRELGKTFILAAIALTAVLGLGGGVLNMIKLGGVTPGQLVRLTALVLPLAAALTLPVAALYSATSTYGRLSADNEFVACRSSGINLYVLFVPTVVLSLFAAGVSFGFTNFLIPKMVRNLNEFIGSDFASLIEQRVNQPQGLTLGDRNKYRIYADRCVADPTRGNRVTLHKAVWVEIDEGDWVRYGTFRELHLMFQQSETPPRVTALALGVSWYDRKLDRFFENERQSIASSEIPSFVPPKVKFLNLNELFHYLGNPTDWHEVRRKMQGLRTDTGRIEVLKALLADLSEDGMTTVADDRVTFSIRARRPQPTMQGDWIDLVEVRIDERSADRQRVITADRANIEITHGDTLADCGVRIELFDARVTDGSRTIERPKVVLGPVAIAREHIDRLSSRSDEQLLASGVSIPDDLLEREREKVRAETGATLRRIVGAINERITFSISVFVLVILGATLGIVFRGAHITAAFGISFIPAMLVIVAIVAGKQMSQNAGTHALGLGVMWGGIAAVAALDLWVLTRVVRR